MTTHMWCEQVKGCYLVGLALISSDFAGPGSSRPQPLLIFIELAQAFPASFKEYPLCAKLCHQGIRKPNTSALRNLLPYSLISRKKFRSPYTLSRLKPAAGPYSSNLPQSPIRLKMEARNEQSAQVTLPTKEVFKCRVLTMLPHTCHR